MTPAARERWNRSWIRTWGDDHEPDQGQYQYVRYFSTRSDGRWFCPLCGMHYVRRCDLARKQCAGIPLGPKATEAIRAAYALEALPRRKVFRNALRKSGASIAAGSRDGLGVVR